MFFHDSDIILSTKHDTQEEEHKKEKVSFFASLFKKRKIKEETLPKDVENDTNIEEDTDEEENKNIFSIFKKYPFVSFFAILFLIGFIYDRNRDFFLGRDTVETSTLSTSPQKKSDTKKQTKKTTKDTKNISLSNIGVVSKDSKKHIQAKKTKSNIQPIEIKPKPKTEAKSGISKPSKKEQILTLKRKSISIISSDISFDILSDNTRVLLSTIPYSKDSKLKEGFYISDLGLKYDGEKKIEDMKITAIVKYKDLDAPIRKLSRSISDLYTINYYEDGIEINSKSSEKTSGIVLPGEKLSSEFTLKSVEMIKDKFEYSLNINGKVHTFMIDEEKVQ